MMSRAILLGALALAACADDPVSPPVDIPETEFVTVKRPWAPGERDSLIAHIVATRAWVFPYVGDISDQAGSVLDPDSAVDIVPNPFVAVSPRRGTAFGPWFHTMVPGTGWTTAGIDIRNIDNTQSPPDTLDWLGWFWYENADNTRKGIILIATAGTTVGYTAVNTTAFDAAGADSGAGGGEARFATGQYWEARGWVRRNQARVTANFGFGGVTTVTTGPYLGGTQQTRLMSGTIDSVLLKRVIPAAPPDSMWASINLSFIGSIALTCVFPTPCTTNALRASRRVTDDR